MSPLTVGWRTKDIMSPAMKTRHKISNSQFKFTLHSNGSMQRACIESMGGRCCSFLLLKEGANTNILHREEKKLKNERSGELVRKGRKRMTPVFFLC